MFFLLLEDILEEYLYDIEVKNYSPRTIKGYKNNNLAFFRFIEADFNITELGKVKAQHIKSYFMYLKKIDRKATYINGILRNIRTFFNYCMDENYITKENNPCLKVGWLKQDKVVIHTFDDAEIGRMIQVFKPSYWWGRARSTAGRTASRARSRSPPKSRRPAPSWPRAETRSAELTAALAGATVEQASRADAAEHALAALNESDAAISAIYETLGRLGQDARVAEEEWRRQMTQRDELEAGRQQTVTELGELETRLHNAQEAPTVNADEPAERARFTAAADAARTAEVEARLAVRTAEERANAVRGRADSLRRAAASEREARVRAERARAAREHAAAVASAVAESGRQVAARLAAVVGVASRTRDQLAAERRQRTAALAAVREQVDALNTRIAALTDSLHRDEVAKAQAAMRIEQLEQHVMEQFGMAHEDLVAEYGPDVPLPPSELELAEYEQARERGEQVTAPAPMPFDRPTQERRAKRAERELGRAGPGQPARARGVRGPGGALPLPVHPAGGRQGHPQGPARRSSDEVDARILAGVHRGVRRRGT